MWEREIDSVFESEGETVFVCGGGERLKVNRKEKHITSECKKSACVQERRTIDRGAAMKSKREKEKKN